MDGTLANANVTSGLPAVRNAVWYRIQAIDTTVTPWLVDLQTPLLRNVFPPPAAPGAPPATQFYVFKGLLEVFDRPQLAPPDYKRQLP